ncbi:MAG: LamG domain-containing protein, partial [Planctomycetes bacterium]|nr:LamG domain-containing protein [Planctomycetota bacterium]
MRTSLLASLGLSLVAPLALAQAPPLLAHWQFDETAGVVASDSSANANNGQLVGFAVTSWVAGQFGNALSFDGSSDYVLIPSNPVVPVYDGLGTPFSISFWVKAPAQSDRRIYSEQQAAPSGGGPLFTLGSGSGSDTDKLRVYIRGDTGTLTPTTATSLGVVFDDSWHHVVYTDHAGRSKIYIDGVLDNAVDYSHWTFGPLSSLRTTFSLDSVTIGAVVRNAAIAAPLLGLIDDVRVYRSVLDDIDVQLLFTDVDPPVIVNSIASYGYGCGAGPLDLAISGSAASGATVYSQLFGGE